MKLLTLVFAILSSLNLNYATTTNTVPEYRYDKASIVDERYDEDYDTYFITIETSDGNLWEYDGAHMMEADMIAVFDTCGTEAVEDDILTEVIIFWDTNP